MVTFYAGNTLWGIAERILQAIPTAPKGKHVVLVPDRYTLAVETAITQRLGASMHVEVVTFARLAMRVMDNAVDRCLTPEGCTMLLAKALDRCKDKLLYYRHVSELPGFVNEMYSSLVAVRNSGVSVADLEAAAQRMRGRSKDKTLDLAAIYNEYLAVLQGQTDPTTRLQAMAKALPDNDEVAATCYYVIDFYCFNQMQYEVLRGLMKYAKEVHIGYINNDVGVYNSRIYPSDLRQKLLDMAAKESVFCQTVLAYEPLPTARQAIQDTLFGYCAPEKGVLKDSLQVSLYRATDTVSELRGVCSEIVKLLRQGYRYRDIAIVCADQASYSDAMSVVFAEYDIPLFCDTKVLLSDEPVVRFLLDILDMQRQNYAFDAVMRVVKNAFFAFDNDEVDYFENYCRKYSIAYTRFLQPFTLGDEEDDIPRAEKVRNQLQQAAIDTAQCATVADYVGAILHFMQQYQIDRRFDAFYHRQCQLGFAEGAKRSEQVPKRLRQLLDTMVRLLGQDPCSAESFVRLLRSSLESVRISLLPQSADCVYIGEAKDSRYDRVRAMFLIGAADSVLPEQPQAGSILTDAYHAALQTQNVVVYPSAKDEGRYARFYLEQILLLPQERLYVGYSATGADNKPRYPSVLLGTLSALFDVPVTEGLPHTLSEEVANRANAYKVLLRWHNRLSVEDVRYLHARLLPQDAKRYDALFEEAEERVADPTALFFGNELTSISQLECYFGCPYRHFVQYGLRAKERQEDTLDVRETGTLLHGVLELFFAANPPLDTMDVQQIDAEIDHCLDVLLVSPRYKGLTASEKEVQLRRLREECHVVVRAEVEYVRQCQYKPTQFEVGFGGKNAPYAAIDLGNGVCLRGKIDRIDRCGDEVVVIDYKSGRKKADLVDLYGGKYLQLHAYMGALQGAGLVPVGGFYKHISGAFARENKAQTSHMSGYVVNDFAVLRRLDGSLETQEVGRYAPVQRKKNEWVATDGGGTVVSNEQMQDMLRYTTQLMQSAVAEIKDGYIAPRPAEEFDCTYCNACDMCANPNRVVRQAPTVTLDSFLEVCHD